MNKVIKVIDTNVFLHDPQSLFKFPEELIVIPISVIEELDSFKRDQGELGRNARFVIKQIDLLREKSTTGQISTATEERKIETYGIELENKGRLIIELNHIDFLKKDKKDVLDQNKVDNRILSVAKYYKTTFVNNAEVVLVTKDQNLRIKSDAFQIKAINYEDDVALFNDEQYSGVLTHKVSDKIYNTVRNANPKDASFSLSFLEIATNIKIFPNQYILLVNSEDPRQSARLRYNVGIEKCVKILPLEEPLWGLTAKNIEQEFALDALLNPDISLVTLTGQAGTGKTLLSIAAALYQGLDQSMYNKILIARPIIPMGKDIGFLPGDMNEKLSPWMQPIFDNLEFIMGLGKEGKGTRGSSKWKELIEQGLIQVEALTYIRGRSIPQQFFIIDEAQNLSKHEVKTILSRAGAGTKIILTGDPDQIDNPYVDQMSNGLSVAIETFKDDEIAAHVTLTKGERSALAEKAVKLIK